MLPALVPEGWTKTPPVLKMAPPEVKTVYPGMETFKGEPKNKLAFP
jgi:hypothetical protein